MQIQVAQQHYWLGRMPAVSMIVPCATAVLLTWGGSSIGGTTDISAPAVLSAMLTPAYSANEGLSATGQESNAANGPMCRGARTPAQVIEASGEPGVHARCATAGNATAGDEREDWAEVATFLEWHVQARHLAQYAYQTTLSVLPPPNANDVPRTALSVAAPLTTFAR